jgi:hypothetical protein
MKEMFTKYEEAKEPSRKNLTVEETEVYLNEQDTYSRSKPEVARQGIAELRAQLARAPKLKVPLVFYNEAQADIEAAYYNRMFNIKNVGDLIGKGKADE